MVKKLEILKTKIMLMAFLDFYFVLVHVMKADSSKKVKEASEVLEEVRLEILYRYSYTD